MIIRFNEQFNLPAAEIYSYFHTPADWPRLFGMAGDSKDLGDGWYAIPLKHFPFSLVAKNTGQEPNKLVRWVFRGFWRGRGEVRFVETADGVAVEGFEEIAVRPLFFLSPFFEQLFLKRRFCAVWEIGWHRLRKSEAPTGSSGA
jgi:hypothetical protein